MKGNRKNLVALRKKKLYVLAIVVALAVFFIGKHRGSIYSYYVPTAKEVSTTTTISIPINQQGTLVNDILSIEHDSDQSAILIYLKPNGRCPNPYLRGRLSGPALSILEWSPPTTTPTASVLKGRYQVPVAGTYLVEIIAITCDNFVSDIQYDFTNTCVEDPSHHRLTRTNVKIHIATANSMGNTGYWMHQQDERAANNDYAAVYTRFQPRGCIRIDDPSHEHFEMPPPHCIEPTDLNRFEPYTSFQYYNGLVPRPFFNVQDLKQPHNTSICLLGHSHSRTLRASMELYHNMTVETIKVQIVWIRAKYPHEVNNKTILSQMVGQCDKVIVAVGQWPASFSGGKPTLMDNYRFKVQRMLERLQFFLSPAVDIIARSVHYNPLNERISSCPPQDWRTPPVMDGYNAVIRQAVKDVSSSSATPNNNNNYGPPPSRIRFVDTNFIVGPLWDQSSDWGHVSNQASHVEALYLVAVALGLIEPMQ